MDIELMSSEESEGETILVKDIPWRSPKATDFFKTLDEQSTKLKSSQAKRQTKQRILSGSSDRPRPGNSKFPSWALS